MVWILTLTADLQIGTSREPRISGWELIGGMNTWYGPNWASRLRSPTISQVVHSNLVIPLYHKLGGILFYWL